jgi:hypothetical protein
MCRAADDSKSPVVRLFTASDFPGLTTGGVKLDRGGRYTLKVWAPNQHNWTLTAEEGTVTLASRIVEAEEAPQWRTLGSVDWKPDEPFKLVLVDSRSAPEPPPTPAPAKKEQVKLSRPIPVPAILALSTDPSFEPSAALDLIRGRIDSTEPTTDPRRTAVRTNRQGVDFQPPPTVEAWRTRAQSLREQILVAVGLWPMLPKTALHPRIVGKLDRDGYSIEKVVLETLPGFTLSGNLYRPSTQTGKLPLMLCPHGHWDAGRVQEDVQQRCVRWAKLGCVVFLYDMVGYADSKPFGHAFLNDRLRRWGLSLVTLQTWNSIRALDWLVTLPDVDPARVACTGESGGGTQTFLLSAIDARIKVAAPVVMVSDWFQGGCTCENAAGLRIGTDNIEIAALTAPRPLKLVGATGDWTSRTMTRAYPTLRSLYALTGTPERISADVFDFPHNYNQTSRNAVYAFVGKWLLGIDDAESTREGEQTVEKPEDLYTFTDQTPAPLNRKTAAELENDLVKTLSWELDSLAPSTSAASWESARALLMTGLRVRVGLVNPPPAAIAETELRRWNRSGITVVHSQIGHAGGGERLAAVRLIPPRHTGRLTLIANPRGKAGLAEPDGSFSTLVQALLDRGQSVVGFDPIFVGESVDPSVPAKRRPESLHFDTYNPTLAGDQMQDQATVLAWARSQPDVREVNLIGLGSSGAQALIARPLLEGLARTALDLDSVFEGDGARELPAALDLPGLLRLGGLKACAALAAPAPLWLFRASNEFDRSWPDHSYRLSDAAHLLRIDASRPAPVDLARWTDSGER